LHFDANRSEIEEASAKAAYTTVLSIIPTACMRPSSQTSINKCGIATAALVLLALSTAYASAGQDSTPGIAQAENVVLISIDGLRWEEVYSGIDPWLLNHDEYTKHQESMTNHFWAESGTDRRKLLMPFFWSTIAQEGQLLGNRSLNNRVNATNGHYFSYPGYNEILSGFGDERIDSNDKINNPNVTVLEFINRIPSFAGKVAAFGSWDVFPYIVNESRSGIPVNAGFEDATGDNLTTFELYLNKLQGQIPSPWTTVRFDAFTHHYALETLKKDRPRLLYIAYGETDDFAHDEDYDAYINSAHQTDAFIAELWNWTQSDDQYRDNTVFIITTDHGRGQKRDWSGHGSDITGAENIWIAAIGAGVPAQGELSTDSQSFQNQIAATVAAVLGHNFTSNHPVGPPLDSIVNRD